MALQVVEPVEEVLDPVGTFLTDALDEIRLLIDDRLAGVADDATQATRIDRIRAWERLAAAVTAAQASEIVGFARLRVADELARDVHPRDIGRGITEEVGLACRTSPTNGARRVSSSRAWWSDLPHTYAALTRGDITTRVAEAVVTETRHLDAITRRQVDERLAGRLDDLGLQEATALTRRYAYEADREAYVTRGRHERTHRRVGLRPAPDTMSVLSGYLPVEQGVACLAALRRHTDTVLAVRAATGDERTRDQIMADTLVERLTGQTRADDVPVEIQIILPADTLTQPDSPRTGTVTGAGPIPGPLLHDLVNHSQGHKRWRIVRATLSGQLVDIEPRRRRFTGALADLIHARDQTCREPFCDAPVRHLDHVHRYTDGGRTTLANGRGLCARHNLTREQPGWSAQVLHDGLGTEPHTVRTTTPTGHTYTSRAPDPP